MKLVKMYTLSTCSHCKQTKNYFNDCGIPFEFTDVDLLKGREREDMIAEVKKVNPNCSFPTILIGDKVIVGLREKEIKEALGL